jgi:hypothetical protein
MEFTLVSERPELEADQEDPPLVETSTPEAVPANAVWSELKPVEKTSAVTAGNGCVVVTETQLEPPFVDL